MEIEKKIGMVDKEEFIMKVLGYVNKEGLSYTEAILEFCEERQIDPEDVAKLITGPLKEKFKIQAVKHNSIYGEKVVINKYIQGCL